MNIPKTWALALILPAVAALPPAHAADTGPGDASARNAALVRGAFDRWARGTGSVFDLLADDVEWTVAGTSPVSGVHRSKREFLDQAVAPITAMLATPIVPQVESIVAQGDDVVAVWRGTATTRGGAPYENHYAWRMTLDDGRIVRATAFLDTWALQQLVRPGPRAGDR